MKTLATLCLFVALAGCEAVRKVAPLTVAGFETNGILGAAYGLSNALLVRCRRLDGTDIRVAIDDVAAVSGAGSHVDRVRAARIGACAKAGAVAVLTSAVSAPPIGG